MEDISIVEDETSGLTYHITNPTDGIYYGQCTTYPQFTFSADSYYGALQGIAKWAHYRKEDSEFYARKNADAKPAPRDSGL